MMNTLREALYFSRNQFQPLLMIALIYAVPAYILEYSTMSLEDAPERATATTVMFISMCLNVLQFGAAMLYIDHISHGQPISVLKAFSMSVLRFPGLFALKILLAIVVGTGLLLFILPGLFFAYKLFFAELYLLLHRQDPFAAMRSSYSATKGLTAELLSPLLFWGSLMLTATLLGSQLVHDSGDLAWAGLLLHQIIMMALNIFGWALVYRLYQRYLEGAVSD
mgnify:CR=1 FL=1